MAKDKLENDAAREGEERQTIQDNQQARSETEDHATTEQPVSEDAQPEEAATDPPQAVVVASRQAFVKRLWHWIASHKKFTIPGVILVLLVLLASIPFTRYRLAGLVLKQDFTVRIVDAQTAQPVSSATVELAGHRAVTDGRGMARLHVRVGHATLTVSKKYFKHTSRTVLVPIARQKNAQQLSLQATGRQVPIVVSNKITKKPLSGATVKALDTEAKTDKEGRATLVVPADKPAVEATIKASGYNELKQRLQVTADANANTIALTPAGKVYFLSNKNGTIDVMKSNLDGSDKVVVVAGTGKENRSNTILLAAQDWRYLALHAKRDSEKAKIYLLDTSSDQLTVMDEGNAEFTLVGWSGHRFIYQVNRNVPQNQPKQQALKSFDASTRALTTLAETNAESDPAGNGYIYEQFGSTFILNNEIVYSKNWQAGWQRYLNYNLFNGKQATFNSVQADGKTKKVIKGYDRIGDSSNIYLTTRLYGPQEVYILRNTNNGQGTIEEYENGTIKPATNVSQDDFYNKPYPTYLASPSNQRTFWSELRDGKEAFFLGDADGGSEEQIGALSEFTAYGWYGNDYLLAAKKGSELYILPAAKIAHEPLKVTDYYRPDVRFEGYGKGYGGL